MRTRTRFAATLFVVTTILAASCTGREESLDTEVLGSPILVAQVGEGTGFDGRTFEAVSDKPILVYRSGCDDQTRCDKVIAVNELGESIDVFDPSGDRIAASSQFSELDLVIDGFTSFRNRQVVLSDGRRLIVGSAESDAEIEIWSRLNPTLDPDGPIAKGSTRPVRVFVYDPKNGETTAVSHWPANQPYFTFSHEGEAPDVVLDVIVLPGELTVAYSAGFSDAAYDLPRSLHLAPIPR